MTELDKLIAEQAADDSSDFVNIKHLGANPIASLSPERLLSVSDDIQAKRQYANRISWGEPAEICQAKLDKCCPVCGKTRADGFELDHESAFCPERTTSYKYSMLYGKELNNRDRFTFDITESHFAF